MGLITALLAILLAGFLSIELVNLTHLGQVGHLFPGWLWGAVLIGLLAWFIGE